MAHQSVDLIELRSPCTDVTDEPDITSRMILSALNAHQAYVSGRLTSRESELALQKPVQRGRVLAGVRAVD